MKVERRERRNICTGNSDERSLLYMEKFPEKSSFLVINWTDLSLKVKWKNRVVYSNLYERVREIA